MGLLWTCALVIDKVCSFWRICCALKRARVVFVAGERRDLLGAGVLGDGLGALRDGVLGQLTGEQQTHGSLDLSGGDGAPPVVVGKTGGLGGDALEDVVHEGVHDGHGPGADASVRVHLLQHFVDVDGVGLPPPPLLLLLSRSCGLGLAGGLLGALGCGFGRHSHLDKLSETVKAARSTTILIKRQSETTALDQSDEPPVRDRPWVAHDWVI